MSNVSIKDSAMIVFKKRSTGETVYEMKVKTALYSELTCLKKAKTE
ncbi:MULTISPECIES: hypothetical protein [Bacillus]|nr:MULTISPECIES: hypothetical protein [Bacillus]MCY8539502.1 hypothetical protein [Bacillus haynesii]